jgi:hypothetical protein
MDGTVMRSGAAVFSEDERHVAIFDKTNIWVDNQPILSADAGSPHGAINPLCFSFDGNDAFHAFATRGHRVVRIDGRFWGDCGTGSPLRRRDGSADLRFKVFGSLDTCFATRLEFLNFDPQCPRPCGAGWPLHGMAV